MEYLKSLTPPTTDVDVVLDTDAFTEIDDLYAISYLLLKKQLHVKSICAAPFYKPPRSESPADGMEKSRLEVLDLLKRLRREDVPVLSGSEQFLKDEQTPVDSPAADFMADLADSYTPQAPLYIVAIGAITNIASALLKNPRMQENCVVIWLGGHAAHFPQGADEYNMRQDIAAARVVFSSGIPLVHLPCNGVVDRFLTTQQELAYWLKGKNDLCDYLYQRTVNEAELYAKGRPWSRVIWDVTAVAWLLNAHGRFMQQTVTPAPLPCYNKEYSLNTLAHNICSVYHIYRDRLFDDLFCTLAAFS